MKNKMTKVFLIYLAIVSSLIISPALLQAQTPLSGDQALKKLLDGNQRFMDGKMVHPHQEAGRRLEVKQGQMPFVTILGCSDSRVPPKIIFDQGVGDLFVTRVAGNTPDDFVIGTLEYGASVLKTPLILVLGHDKCGAVEASLKEGPFPGHIEEIVKAIRPALKKKTCKKDGQLKCAIKDNVAFVVEKLKNSQPILAPLVKSGKLKIVGAVYDLGSGKVTLTP